MLSNVLRTPSGARRAVFTLATRTPVLIARYMLISVFFHGFIFCSVYLLRVIRAEDSHTVKVYLKEDLLQLRPLATHSKNSVCRLISQDLCAFILSV